MPSALAAAAQAQAATQVRDAMRWVAYLAANHNAPDLAARAFIHQHPRSTSLELVRRAAVSGGTPDGWGGPLRPGEPVLYDAFLATVTDISALGRLNPTPAEFFDKYPVQTAPGRARYVGPGGAFPVTSGGVGNLRLEPRKVGAIAVATRELLDATDSKALGVLERILRGALVQAEDTAFLDPANPGDVETPTSITYGATAIPSTGFTPDAVKADVEALAAILQTAGVPLASVAFITSTANALALAALTYPTGAPAFPGLGTGGGVILGAPLVASDWAGPQLVAVATDYLLAAEGGFEVETSREGTLEMDDAPVGDVGAPAGPPTAVSLFQTNTTALKAVREANWGMRWPDAVARISGFSPPLAARSEPRGELEATR
jgi:hypothetical protein